MKELNFLVFMTDQQNGDTQPPYSKALMPNLERLYRNGVAFSKAYCPAPHCCPSRATFFTGLYPTQHGVWNNVDLGGALSKGLYDNVRLFSEDFADAGYDMYFSGKWHVSAQEGPDNRGFHLVHHLQHQNKGYKIHPSVPDTGDWRWCNQNLSVDGTRPKRDGEIQREGYPEYIHYGEEENPFRDQDVINAAKKTIEELDTERPFFMYVGPLGPHDPYQVPQRYLDMYPIEDIELPKSFYDTMEDKPALYRRTRDRFAHLTEKEHKEAIRHYLAFCTYEDFLFGEVLDSLEKRGLLENTVVMYLSDHGDYMGAHGLWTKGLPCFQEAYHICSVIGYGGIKTTEKTIEKFVSLSDYAPTLLELAGIHADRSFAGKSLVPFLSGERCEEWREELYTQSNGNELYGIQRGVFDKEYKLVYNGFDYDEFYDLKRDPQEMHNLIHEEKYQAIIKQMYQKLWSFAFENQDNIADPYITTALATYGPDIIFKE